jgi:hypothetical protein
MNPRARSVNFVKSMVFSFSKHPVFLTPAHAACHFGPS